MKKHEFTINNPRWIGSNLFVDIRCVSCDGLWSVIVAGPDGPDHNKGISPGTPLELVEFDPQERAGRFNSGLDCNRAMGPNPRDFDRIEPKVREVCRNE